MKSNFLQTQLSLLASLIPAKWKGSFKQTLADMPRLVSINITCALILTYALHAGGSLWVNIVVSMCVGTTAYILIRGISSFIWADKDPHPIAYYALCLLVAPPAFIIGFSIAATFFNFPLNEFLHFRSGFVGNFIIITSIVSIVGAWSFWNKARIAQLVADAEAEKAKNAAIEKQALQTQLQLLQAQIEPHMLFNTLANLQGLIAIDPARAQHMLTQLIIYLRATLSTSRAEQTSLKQEFALIQAYLELLAIRMGKRLQYTLTLPDELQQAGIAPMLLQPLVENAIKHGLEPKMEGGSIHVAAKSLGGYLHLKVIDTGLGLPFNYDDSDKADADGQHIGNANIRDRLLALYGPGASLSLTPNQPEGVIAHLILPLHS